MPVAGQWNYKPKIWLAEPMNVITRPQANAPIIA